MTNILELLFAIKTINNISRGAERVLVDVSRELVERGHRVSLVTFDPPSAISFYPLHPSIQWVKLNIGRPTQRTSAFEMFQRVFFLRRMIMHIGPDAVIGFMHSIYLPLGIALYGTAIPIIASEHTVRGHYRQRLLEHFLLQFAPFFSKRITVVSEKVRCEFGSHLRRHMTVIPNPVCLGRGRANVVGEAHSRKQLLSVGSLTMEKDHKTLIDAYAMVADDFPEWDLRIIGEGDLRAMLEEQVRLLNLQRRVALVGATPDVAQEYLAAQLFVIPSRYESFGLATAEAMAHGLPVIGFADCPGTNELVRHDHNGCLVCGVDRVTSLSRGLRYLMSTPMVRKRLGDAGPPSVASYSIENICDQWESLLRLYAR